MIRQGKNLLMAGVLAFAVTACFDDPTGDLRGGASQVVLDRTTLLVFPSATASVLVYLQDAQGNTLPVGTVTWSSNDPAVATVAPDTVNLTPGGSSARAFITGVSGGATYVKATIGGFSDSVYVATVPETFTGAVTGATSTIGDTVTVAATALVTFNPALSSVTVEDGPVEVVSVTTTQLRFIPPEVSAGTVTITGLVFLGGIPLDPLNLSTAITVTDPTEPANDGLGTAPAITIPAAIGDSTILWGSMSSTDGADFYTVTSATTDSLEFRLSWPGGASTNDFDMYLLNNVGTLAVCADDFFACSAGTGSNPETGAERLVASQVYKLAIFWYSGPGPAAYRLRVTKR